MTALSPGVNESDLSRDIVKARVKARLLGGDAHVRFGRFELLRELGRGATGTVFEARDIETDRNLALKALRGVGPQDIYRFKREFRALASIVHPNLVALRELFCVDGQWAFSMDLVRGVAWSQYVCPHGQLDQARLWPALSQTLAGLAHLHAHGKIHCDLKPSNVLIDASGRVSLLDFSLVNDSALSVESQIEETGVSGTPGYMAPEQTRARRLSPATDVYALGVMLAEVSRGHRGLQELCAAMLRAEPEARPSVPEIYERLQSLSHVPMKAPLTIKRAFGTSPRLVGRDRELDLLGAAVQRAWIHAPVMMLVGGASGVGKSALVAHFTSQLQDDVVVLSGRCYERESMPYKAFDSVIDDLARQLRALPSAELAALVPRSAAALLRVFPVLGRVPGFADVPEGSAPYDQRELRKQAFETLKTLLRNLAYLRRIVICVDDLQWGDIDSVRLLGEVMGPPHAPRLAFLGCYRDTDRERSELLRELLAEDSVIHAQCDVQHLVLSSLHDDAARAIALHHGTGAAPLDRAVIERVVREAAGLPLFLVELTRDAMTVSDGSVHTSSLHGLMQRRLDKLDASARGALETLAVAARPLDEAIVAEATGCSDASSLLFELHESLFARRTSRGWTTYHDRIREECLVAMPQALRTQHHARLARAYECSPGTDSAWLVEHYREAGDSVRAIRCALAAAETATEKLAFNRAAQLFRMSLELIAPDDPDTPGLWRRLGDALANAGRGALAADAYLNAVDGRFPRVALELRCAAASQLLRCGKHAEGKALAIQLLASVGVRVPTTGVGALIALLYQRARSRMPRWRSPKSPSEAMAARLHVLGAVFRELSMVEPLQGAVLQMRFLNDAARAGSREQLFLAHAYAALMDSWFFGSTASAHIAAQLREVDTLASELSTAHAQAHALHVRGAVAFFSGRFAEVASPIERAQAMFRTQCVGTHWEEAIASCIRYANTEPAGPVGLAILEAPGLLRAAHERDDRFTDGFLALAVGLAHLAEDDSDGALRFLERQMGRLHGAFDTTEYMVVTRIADTHLYAGRARTALAFLDRVWPRYRSSIFPRSEFMRIAMLGRRLRCAVAVLAEHEDVKLRARTLHDLAVLARSKRDDAACFVAHLRGAMAWQDGRADEARQLLDLAIQCAERGGMALYALCTARQRMMISGDPDWERHTSDIDASLRAQGIGRPDRWVKMYVPL